MKSSIRNQIDNGITSAKKPMKPAQFKYFAPDTLEEVLSLLNEHGDDAKVIAGGQSLVPMMNFRLAQPAIIIDLNLIHDLFFIRPEDDGRLMIGAMTRHMEIEKSRHVFELAPLLSEAVPYIAHPQIRNRGTIGGSIAHADPAAELPAIMLALDARFNLQSSENNRWVKAKDFFLGLLDTALEPNEILRDIELPAVSLGSGYAFCEVARRHGDYAIVGVAAVVNLDDQGKCSEARVVLLSVGDGPVDASQAAQNLVGENPTEKAIEDTADIVAERDIEPTNDIHASTEFRRHLAKILSVQALTRAFERVRKSN